MAAAQVRDPLVLVLLAAAALAVATGDWTDASVIMLVIVVNTAVGVTQEVKAGQAIAALSRLTAPEARVLRGREQRVILAADVVAGDVLVLAEGDIVPADAQVVEAAALLAGEAEISGTGYAPQGQVCRDGRPLEPRARRMWPSCWPPPRCATTRRRAHPKKWMGGRG